MGTQEMIDRIVGIARSARSGRRQENRKDD